MLRQNKKGLSTILEYVILVAITIALSSGAYVLLKSYVPKDQATCQDGVSIYLQDYACQIDGEQVSLTTTVKNTGRFNIAGYYIRASTNSEKKINLDLSDSFLEATPEATTDGGYISIKNAPSTDENNRFVPASSQDATFLINSHDITAIELVPVKVSLEGNKIKLLNCPNARVIEEITCS